MAKYKNPLTGEVVPKEFLDKAWMLMDNEYGFLHFSRHKEVCKLNDRGVSDEERETFSESMCSCGLYELKQLTEYKK